MKKTMALLQVLVITLVVGFATYHLFKGNFEVAFTSLPLLMAYYVFITGRQKRAQMRESGDEEQ
jgi:hypothetical protein